MSKQQNGEIRFQLSNIELVGAELSLPADFTMQEIYEYDFLMESRINNEKKMIRLKLEIKVKVNDVKFGSLTSVFWYSLDDFDKVIVKNRDGKYEIPEGLQVTLNSISISTARGLMFSAFRGTALHNAILPVIDPKQFTGKS